ncbi:Tfp pilus assembly protein PilN [Desulfonispora thiosulfatigenes DSM 11270]|uniref:Tfp pilus assembly protein PilN n=1 Tax=Desulfonispora thiosulfatigenes DSM 11270 TaxID=656914 RepID=A0A1W1VNS2_DESTI|nr:PilN domain-containing protein [Desulfonispora thiosulfatigenes]SMB95007.1 Tfp pilus assembly protein PilN [Desulfonispora thiosulfatigenes DSM 11270]
MRDINFFSYYIDRKGSSKKKLYILISTLAIFILFTGITTTQILKANHLEKKINLVQAELSNPEMLKKAKEIEKKKEKVDLLRKHYNIVKKINQQIVEVDKFHSHQLEVIADSLPQQSFIKDISVDNETIKIQGIATNNIAVAELEHNLKKTLLFDDVHVDIINDESASEEMTSAGNKQFNLICTFFKDVNNGETN